WQGLASRGRQRERSRTMSTRTLDSRTGRSRVACTLVLLAGLMLAGAATVWAQSDAPAAADNPSAPKPTARAVPPIIELGHFRPHDARGLNVVEAPKAEGVPYDGFKIQWGAAFNQQFQGQRPAQTATPV